eukprot:gb/GEZN01003179.1/.p1 GENE.gb/GEZN01003179.1/~~gb/GEZN01003179.1/.p1  ORF type:complete len:652 (-),score=101.45 gb/GEZN01003179.1/:252-2207(-)
MGACLCSSPKAKGDEAPRLERTSIAPESTVAMSTLSAGASPKKEKFFLASGASIQEDSATAMKEAYKQMVEDFAGRCNPKMPIRLIIGMASPSYDHDILAKTLIALAGKVQFVITTSADGAISNQMLAMSDKNYGLSLQGFKCDEPDAFFGVGHAVIHETGNYVSCGAKATKEAVKKMGILDSKRWNGSAKDHKIQGDYVVFFSSAEYPDFTRSEHLLFDGVRSVLGEKALMCGGTACCNSDFSGKPYVTAGSDGNYAISMTALIVAIIVVPPSVCVVSTSKGFFDPTPLSSAKVTSNGEKPGFPSERIVGTLDDKPAAEVMDEWWNGRLKPLWESAKEKKEPVSILLEFAMNPCGRLFKSSKGAAFGLCSALEILPDGSISFLVPMPVGIDMMAFEGTQDRILDKMSYTGSWPENEILGGFASICCLATWPNRKRVAEYRERYQSAKMPMNQSFAVMCAYGEVGCAEGSGAVEHYNCSFTETLFVSTENEAVSPSRVELSSSVLNKPAEPLVIKETLLRKMMDGDDSTLVTETAIRLFNGEMLAFWEAVEEFASWRATLETKGIELADVLKFKTMFDELYLTYIKAGVKKEINIPSRLRNQLLKVYRKEVLGIKDVDVIFHAQMEVEQLITTNVLPTLFKDHPELEKKYE